MKNSKMNFCFLSLFLTLLFVSCGEATIAGLIHPEQTNIPQQTVIAPEPVPTGNLARILTSLNNPSDQRIMICAHRGVETDRLPENSLATIQRSIELGMDIVEIDLNKTKDGKLILMHDQTLDRTTTGSGKVSDMTLSEIKSLYLKDDNGNVTEERVPAFEEVLTLVKGEILIQVDKWRGLTNDILPMLQQHECLQQSIFRSTTYYDQVKPIFGDYMEHIIFIPVIPADREDADRLLDDYLLNMPDMPVVSVVFSEVNNPLLNKIPDLKKKYRIWFNAIQDKDCAGHGDKLAETDPENSFGWLIDKGANIIFTHKPLLLKSYLQNR
jgi:glycerophosphoryl diester phosphodiesterase